MGDLTKLILNYKVLLGIFGPCNFPFHIFVGATQVLNNIHYHHASLMRNHAWILIRSTTSLIRMNDM